MGPNESWMSDVERELKRAQDQLTGLSINQLALQSQGNYDLPSRIQQPEQVPQQEELIWITLNSKTIVNQQVLYSWRRQIKLFGPQGFVWVDTGEASTFFEYPATGLNNENLDVGDGKRYPAKWNADTGQWIFFLKVQVTPAPPPVTSGNHYGIKTWVEWINRQGLPATATALADDLEKPRIIPGDMISSYNSTAYTRKTPHPTLAYTWMLYEDYQHIKVTPYVYVNPLTNTNRSIPGIGATDQSTQNTYFLYADPTEIAGNITVGTYTGNPSNGTQTLTGVHFHFDENQGANITQNVATGNIHFDWNFYPDTSTTVDIRLSPTSNFPTGSFNTGISIPGTNTTLVYSSSDLSALQSNLTTWRTIPFVATDGTPPRQMYYSDSSPTGYTYNTGSAKIVYYLTSFSRNASFYTGSPVYYPSRWAGADLTFTDGPPSQTWLQFGDYYPGGPLGWGYYKVTNGVRIKINDVIYNSNEDGSIEVKWGNVPSSVLNPETP